MSRRVDCETILALKELAQRFYRELECVSPPRGLCDHLDAIAAFLTYAAEQLCADTMPSENQTIDAIIDQVVSEALSEETETV